jgi:hypothetical protein
VPAIGMGLGWLGYSLGLWGWSLLRGYNVTLGQLMSPTHPYAGAWPPPLLPNTQTLPGKQQATQVQTTSTATAPPVVSGAGTNPAPTAGTPTAIV